MDRQRIVEASKGVGKPKVGGDFELVDQEGRKFTQSDMKGGYSLVSAQKVSVISVMKRSWTMSIQSRERIRSEEPKS